MLRFCTVRHKKLNVPWPSEDNIGGHLKFQIYQKYNNTCSNLCEKLFQLRFVKCGKIWFWVKWSQDIRGYSGIISCKNWRSCQNNFHAVWLYSAWWKLPRNCFKNTTKSNYLPSTNHSAPKGSAILFVNSVFPWPMDTHNLL